MISKDLKQEIAFAYLNDLRIKFLKNFDSDRIYTAFAYELKPFNSEIKKLMDYYTKNLRTKNEILQESLVDTVGIIKDSYENILDRNQRLTVVNEKTNILVNNSYQTRENVFYFLKK